MTNVSLDSFKLPKVEAWLGYSRLQKDLLSSFKDAFATWHIKVSKFPDVLVRPTSLLFAYKSLASHQRQKLGWNSLHRKHR